MLYEESWGYAGDLDYSLDTEIGRKLGRRRVGKWEADEVCHLMIFKLTPTVRMPRILSIEWPVRRG